MTMFVDFATTTRNVLAGDQRVYGILTIRGQWNKKLDVISKYGNWCNQGLAPTVQIIPGKFKRYVVSVYLGPDL